MVQLDTPIEIQTALVSRLQSWHDNSPLLPDPAWSPSLLALICSQDDIGWKNFLEGLPSKMWIPMLASSYANRRIKKCPRRWLRKVLLSVHELAWQQWDHRNQILHTVDEP